MRMESETAASKQKTRIMDCLHEANCIFKEDLWAYPTEAYLTAGIASATNLLSHVPCHAWAAHGCFSEPFID
jgi:hypothetical protein